MSIVSISPGENNNIELNSAQLKSFTRLKVLLAKSTAIAHPISVAELHRIVDASNIGVGGVFHQNRDGQLVPLGFFSKTLQSSERRSSTMQYA